MKRLALILGLILISIVANAEVITFAAPKVNLDRVELRCPRVSIDEDNQIINLQCEEILADGSKGETVQIQIANEPEERGKKIIIKDGKEILVDDVGDLITEMEEDGKKVIYRIDDEGTLLLDPETLKKRKGIGSAHFVYDMDAVLKEANPAYDLIVTDGQPDRKKLKAELEKKIK